MGKKKKGLKPKFPLGRWVQTNRMIEGRQRRVWVKAYKKNGKRRYKIRLTNPHEKKYRKGRSLFRPAKYKKYSKIVSFKDPEDAFISSGQLLDEFVRSKQKDKKLRIARVSQYASNRAFATSKKKDLSQKERNEFIEIGKIYKRSANGMWKEYNKL